MPKLMSPAKKSFEEQYPSLLEWKFLRACEDPAISECAKNICKLIINFNDITRKYHGVIEEKKGWNVKVNELSERCKRLERKCETCLTLQKRLDDQDSKMKTLADIFVKISGDRFTSSVTSKTKETLEKAHDFFTQIVDAGNPQENEPPDPSRAQKRKKEPSLSPNLLSGAILETPNKRRGPLERKTHEVSFSPSTEEEREMSPIIASKRSGKTSQGSKASRSLSRSLNKSSPADRKSPNPTLVQSPEITKMCNLEPSVSILHPTIDNDKSENLCAANSKNETRQSPNGVSVTPVVNRRSLSMLSKKIPMNNDKQISEGVVKEVKRKKVTKGREMKQSRLQFLNANKKMLTVDVSSADSFNGGVRNLSGGDVQTGNHDKALQEAIKMSLNDIKVNKKQSEEEDIIEASPSYVQHSAIELKKQKSKANRGATFISSGLNKEHSLNPEGEETMMITFMENGGQDVLCDKTKSKTESKSPLKLSFPLGRSNVSSSKTDQHLDNIPPEVLRAKVLMKNTEKKKTTVPAKSNIEEFYKAAFKDNNDLMRETMQKCTRFGARGNQERRCTPPGFWDLNMPTTQDTEAINHNNNSQRS